MVTRYSAWLNGIGLQDIDERIAIMDIGEKAPMMETNTVRNGAWDGQRVLRQYRSELSVVISFAIEEYDTARRKEICRRIAAWAMGGGWLTVSDRPDQRLQVVCTGLPVIPSARNWLDEMQVTFTAFAVPYWQDNSGQAVEVTAGEGTEGIGSVRAMGNAGRALIEFDALVTGGTLHTLHVTVGETFFHLTGLTVNAGGTVRAYYDDAWQLCLEAAGVSIYGSRSPLSSDDLLAGTGGRSVIRVSADAEVRVRIRPRGLYL